MHRIQIESLEARQLMSASAANTLHAQVGMPTHLLLGPLPVGTNPSALYVSAPGTIEQVNAAAGIIRGKKVFARDTLTFLVPGAHTVDVSTTPQGTPIFSRQVTVGPTGPFSNSTIRVRRSPIDQVVVNQQTFAPAELIGVPSSIAAATATVDWGDGTAPDAVSVTNSNGILDPAASHVYTTAKAYIAKVVFSIGTHRLAFAREVVHVRQDSLAGTTLKLTTGTPYSGALGSVTMLEAPKEVAIYWGDGTHSFGTATSPGKHHYEISGTHTYVSPANYQIRLVASEYLGQLLTPPGTIFPLIAFPQGDLAQAFSTAVVNGPSITLPARAAHIAVPTSTLDAPADQLNDSSITVTPVGADAFDNVVYATVDWGDGSPLSAYPLGAELDTTTNTLPLRHTYDTYGDPTPVDKTVVVSMQIYLNDHDDPSKNTLLGTARVTVHVHNP